MIDEPGEKAVIRVHYYDPQRRVGNLDMYPERWSFDWYRDGAYWFTFGDEVDYDWSHVLEGATTSHTVIVEAIERPVNWLLMYVHGTAKGTTT
jgi:hypothetical protein